MPLMPQLLAQLAELRVLRCCRRPGDRMAGEGPRCMLTGSHMVQIGDWMLQLTRVRTKEPSRATVDRLYQTMRKGSTAQRDMEDKVHLILNLFSSWPLALQRVRERMEVERKAAMKLKACRGRKAKKRSGGAQAQRQQRSDDIDDHQQQHRSRIK